jgi:hypothetical protein
MGVGSKVVAAIFTAIVLLGVYWLFVAVIVALSLITRHSANVLTEHTIELTGEGIAEQTPHTRRETRWPGIRKVGVTRR